MHRARGFQDYLSICVFVRQLDLGRFRDDLHSVHHIASGGFLDGEECQWQVVGGATMVECQSSWRGRSGSGRMGFRKLGRTPKITHEKSFCHFFSEEDFMEADEVHVAAIPQSDYASFFSNEYEEEDSSIPELHFALDLAGEGWEEMLQCELDVEVNGDQAIDWTTIRTIGEGEAVVSVWNMFCPSTCLWPPPDETSSSPLIFSEAFNDAYLIASMSDMIAMYSPQGIILQAALVNLLHQFISVGISETRVRRILETHPEKFKCFYLNGPFTLVMISDARRIECKAEMASKYIGGRFRKLQRTGMFSQPSILMDQAESVETSLKVVLYCWDILKIERDSVRTMFTMKSVKLANQVRQRVGLKTFKMIKETFDGFLNLLEFFPDLFHIERIPKEDRVTLRTTAVQDWTIQRLFADLKDATRGQLHCSPDFQPESQPNKSLHVGNVPSFFTEDLFAHEFSSFYPLSTNLVTQKGRRYGFINFATIEQAKYAKNMLSKTKLWKSNISFAKRETHAMTRVTTLYPPLPRMQCVP